MDCSVPGSSFTSSMCFLRTYCICVTTVTCVVRVGSANHPCLSGRGHCAQICIPHGRNGRRCGCSVGYRLQGETECRPFDSFALVSQLKMARGFDLHSGQEAMVPIAGKGDLISITWWTKASSTTLNTIQLCFSLLTFQGSCTSKVLSSRVHSSQNKTSCRTVIMVVPCKFIVFVPGVFDTVATTL